MLLLFIVKEELNHWSQIIILKKCQLQIIWMKIEMYKLSSFQSSFPFSVSLAWFLFIRVAVLHWGKRGCPGGSSLGLHLGKGLLLQVSPVTGVNQAPSHLPVLGQVKCSYLLSLFYLLLVGL